MTYNEVQSLAKKLFGSLRKFWDVDEKVKLTITTLREGRGGEVLSSLVNASTIHLLPTTLVKFIIFITFFYPPSSLSIFDDSFEREAVVSVRFVSSVRDGRHSMTNKRDEKGRLPAEVRPTARSHHASFAIGFCPTTRETTIDESFGLRTWHRLQNIRSRVTQV